jgi:hypothetical protein
MKLRRVSIEPAENGYTLEKHYDQEPGERYEEPTRTVHESVESVLQGIKECLSGSHTKKGKKMRRLGSAVQEGAVASKSRY